MATTKLAYTTRQIEIDRAALTKFKQLKNARDIRNGKVDSLTELLEGGGHFHTGFVVNVRDDKWRLLDGTHRYLAVSAYLTRHPAEKIVVEVHFYKGLSDTEEMEIFTIWNQGMKQNTSDFLKQYWDTLNIQKKINDDTTYPIHVIHKNNGTKIGLSMLFFPYLTRNDLPYAGGYEGSALIFIEKLQSWNNGKTELTSDGIDAMEDMRAFLKDYIFCFGAYNPKNLFWKPLIYYPMFRIWYENKGNLTIDDLRLKMKKLSNGEGLNAVRFWQGMGAARSNCNRAVGDYLKAINGTAQRNRLYITSSRNIVDKQGKKNKEKIKIYSHIDIEVV
jgi:hypothetical protein